MYWFWGTMKIELSWFWGLLHTLRYVVSLCIFDEYL